MKTLPLQSFRSGLQRWSLCAALFSAVAVSPLLASNVVAQEFQSISINAAILYDGPSANSKRLFIAPRGMPVRVITVAEPFVKVRDMGGDVAWVERRSLGSVRTLIALATTNLRFAANDTANVVVQIERGVVVELLDAPANGFVRVKHADGSQGFVKTSEVWGL
jgi:SH3-like domain-containing protein